jgi:hypothetical protein
MKAHKTTTHQFTLLELVSAIGNVLQDDSAVGAAVGALVNSGAVRFQGDLAGRRVRVVPTVASSTRLAA